LIIPENDMKLFMMGFVTSKELQEKYGVTRQAVSFRYKYKKQKEKTYKKKFTVRFLYGIGFTNKEIMDETGYKSSTIRGILTNDFRIKSVKEVYNCRK